MQSKAKTVDAYLESLPADRRAAIKAVRDVLRRHLDPEYEEGMGYGMIGWSVPHRIYPPGYHCKPEQALPFAGLASQKNYMSLYIMSVYDQGEEQKWLRQAWAKSGKKLDMGKCCIRFKRVEDLPLDVIGELASRIPARAWAAHYAAQMDPRTGRPRSSRPSKAKAAAKPAKGSARKKAAKKAGKKAVAKAPKRAARTRG